MAGDDRAHVAAGPDIAGRIHAQLQARVVADLAALADNVTAIAAWQRDEGLRASGYLTADQIRELRRQTGT